MQLSSLHIHGAVLGSLHIVCIVLFVMSVHKQLAIESHTITQFEYIHSQSNYFYMFKNRGSYPMTKHNYRHIGNCGIGT